MVGPDTSRISPTAHYTGHVWCRHGLSPKTLSTTTGRLMFEALRGPMAIAKLVTGGTNLETLLRQRHLIIDHCLGRAIDEGRVSQVVEVAAGISGRGLRFAARYPELLYVETDLPDMVAQKRSLLSHLPARNERLKVDVLNALVDEGATSLAAIAKRHLDPSKGVAIITEGLLSYLGRAEVEAMWARFASTMQRYPHAVYLSDVHLDGEHMARVVVQALRALIRRTTRTSNHLHFRSSELVEALWTQLGAEVVTLHRPRVLAPQLSLPIGWGPDYVGVIEARTVGPRSTEAGSIAPPGPPR